MDATVEPLGLVEPLELAEPPGRAPGLRPAASTSYRPRHPIDLHSILGTLDRGPYDPTVVWDAAGVWRTFRTPHGPTTLRLVRTTDGIDASAWGPGAEWAIDGVPELLGALDDWSELDLARYPLLGDSLHRNPGLRLVRTRSVFDALVPAILEQKVTSVEAYRSWGRLVRAHGEAAPGPVPSGLRVMPSAAQWRLIPSWEWHRAGVDPRRSRAIVTAAQRAPGLERTLEPGIDGDEVARRMRSVPGIGVWTAAETAQRSHGDPDALSVGDYSLASIVGIALTGTEVDDDGMLELLAPWAGQRQRIVRLILASGVRVERHAPRAEIRDHRRH